MTRRTPQPCTCGCSYQEFRTGLSFADVRRMMFRASDDPADWRQKRRHSVLGFWRELKLSMFYSDHGTCENLVA